MEKKWKEMIIGLEKTEKKGGKRRHKCWKKSQGRASGLKNS